MQQDRFFVFNEAIRRSCCQRQNTSFKNYIGQDGPVERLLDLLYEGQSNHRHCVRENVVLTGPPSTGKTTLTKMLAQDLEIPFVSTDSNQVNSGVSFGGKNVKAGANTVIHLILDTWAKEKIGPLNGKKAGSFTFYDVPPTVVFIDEIHGLNRKTSDALLKATERSDGMLFGSNVVLNCKDVLWVGATTDWGKLVPAFRTRFSRIDLTAPTFDEVVNIVSINFPHFSNDVCRKIVFYGSTVPRESLSFARTVMRYSTRVGMLLEDCVWECAKREGIDEWGMAKKRVDILKSLEKAPNGMILRNLAASLGCVGDEVVNYWLPPLMFRPVPLVVVEQSRYLLTQEGHNELSKRK